MSDEYVSFDETLAEEDARFLMGLGASEVSDVPETEADPAESAEESAEASVAVEDEEEFDADEFDEDESDEDESETKAALAKCMGLVGDLQNRLRAAEEEMALRQRELDCMNLLSVAGLPSELASAVMAADDMAAMVELIGRVVKEAVTAEMRQRCVMEPPARGGDAPLTKEELLRLPVAELQRIRGVK